MESYKRLCTEFYDIDKPVAPADALAFYLQYALAAQGPILEPMCGTGRFLAPMLERGLSVDGVDGSPQMLEVCRARCCGLNASLRVQMMHELVLDRRYALVFIPAGSFGLLSREHACESLRRLRVAMLPGATLLIEMDRYKPQASSSWPWAGRWVDRSDGARIIISWMGQHDAHQRVTRSIHRYDLVKDGLLLQTEFESFDQTCYDEGEFRSLLSDAGFTGIRALKVYAPREADPNDDDVVYECHRV